MTSPGSGDLDGWGNLVTKRHLRRWNATRIPPTKKPNFDFSGDMTDTLPPLSSDEVRPGYEGLEDLIEEGGDDVKRLFSIEFATAGEKLRKRIENVKEQIKDHPADLKSVEQGIAMRTVLIRGLMQYHYECKKNKVQKTRLYHLIQGRKKMMKFLRRVDQEKFEWLCKELKLDYVDVPEPFEILPLSKRETREKAARDAAEKLRAEKFEIFREKLNEQRREYEIFKTKEMEDILKEMDNLGLEFGNSLDDALVALGDDPYTPPKERGKRWENLEKKFIKYAKGGPRQQRKAQRAALAAAAGKK